jgi:hypothetical protein
MNAARKLMWMVAMAITAVAAVLVVVLTVGQAQTGEKTGIQAPGNDTTAPVAEALLASNDVPGTPPSPEQMEV